MAQGPDGFAPTILTRMGRQALSLVRFAGGFAILSRDIFRELFTPPFYFRLVVQQVFSIGIQSFLLVAVTGLATGCVMALQFGYGLKKFGGTLYVPNIASLAILREMGPVFTSLLVAGRNQQSFFFLFDDLASPAETGRHASGADRPRLNQNPTERFGNKS